MRVLWVLSVDPTRAPDGQLTYSLAFIKAVAAAGVDVTVVHLGSRAPDLSGAVGVSASAHPIVWRPTGTANRNRLGSLVSRLPAMAYTAGSAEFRRVLADELTQRWDAIVIDHVQSGWAMDLIDDRRDATAVVVHASHNDERTVRRRVAAGTSKNPATRLVLELDARKVAALEDRILRGSGIVTTITEADAAAFRSRGSARDPLVLSPGYDGARLAQRDITDAVPRRAVIAGSMLWRVKQFDLLALLRVADPRFAAAGAEIVVIGEAPPELESEILGFTTATTMAGRVDSFAEAFADARLALVSEPHGGGFKLKTLDYVFQRVPLFVETGSVTGLPLENGRGIAEYADTEALVAGALRMLDDVAALNRLQHDAYARCEPVFDWATRGAQLRDAIVAARSSA